MRFTSELTALVAAPMAIWIVLTDTPYVFDVTIALVAILALHEFLSLGRAKGYDLPIYLCIAIMLVIMAAFILQELSVEFGMFTALLVIPASFVFMARSILQDPPVEFGRFPAFLFIPASYVFSRKPLQDSLPSSAIAVLAT